MVDIYLPTLHWFAMKNPFSGSCGELRFYIKPKVEMASGKEVDFAASTLVAKIWHGPYCLEKSTVEEEKIFPLSEEGRTQLKVWLEASV